jgi:hypothetical protein
MPINCSKGFCHGISHKHILSFNQINPLYYFLYPWPLQFKSCRCISLCHLIHTCNVFPYYLLSFFFPLSPTSENMFFLSLYVCVCVCVCVCKYIHTHIYMAIFIALKSFLSAINQTIYIAWMYMLYVCMYDHVCICACIYLLDLASIYKRKHVNLAF